MLSYLRNAIAHANGRRKMVNEKIRDKIQKCLGKGIGIEYHDIGYFIVYEIFLKETFRLVKTDLEDLVERYKELDNSRRLTQPMDKH